MIYKNFELIKTYRINKTCWMKTKNLINNKIYWYITNFKYVMGKNGLYPSCVNTVMSAVDNLKPLPNETLRDMVIEDIPTTLKCAVDNEKPILNQEIIDILDDKKLPI